MLSLSDRNVLCHILWSFRAVRRCERQDHPPPAPQRSPGESLCLCCYLCFFFSCVCVIPLSIGDRVPVAVLLWRGLWPHQRPGLQDSGERVEGCAHHLHPVDPAGHGGHPEPSGRRSRIQSPIPPLLHPSGSCPELGTFKTGVEQSRALVHDWFAKPNDTKIFLDTIASPTQSHCG